MSTDPLDHLKSFYDDCRTAPVPESLTSQPVKLPWWLRLSVPIAGLTLGGLLALLLIAMPNQASPGAGADAARALSKLQIDMATHQPAEEGPVPSEPHADTRRGGRQWIG